jgi:hypothetical protein
MTNDGRSDDKNQPVVVTSAPTLEQACVIRAVLQTAGIAAFVPDETAAALLSHLKIAIHRKGINVAVRQCDLETAREVLDAPPPTGEEWQPLADDEQNRTDKYASSAARAVIFSLLIFPLGVMTFYYFFRALGRQHENPPTDRGKYRRNMIFALCYMIVVILLVGWWFQKLI